MMTPIDEELDEPTGELPGRQCIATRIDGARCLGRALSGGDLCFAHAPELEPVRAASRTSGGRRPTLKRLPGMTAEVNSPEDVLKICNTLLGTLMERDASPGSIAAISRVLGLCLDTLTGIQMEQRVAALEEKADAIEG